jgi:hypothetical protein
MNTKHTFAVLLLAAGLLASTTGSAGAQKPLSTKGYWVAETSAAHPGKTIVRYYTWQHQLVHTEVITGRKIKFRQKQLQALKEKTDIAISVAATRP